MECLRQLNIFLKFYCRSKFLIKFKTIIRCH